MQWNYFSPMLFSEFALRALHQRVWVNPNTTDIEYVKPLREGMAARSTGASAGSPWTWNGRTFDTYGTQPLHSDQVFWKTGANARYEAAHISGRPLVSWSANLWWAGKPPPRGTNAVWEDGHVEWHNWQFNTWASAGPGASGGTLYNEVAATGTRKPIHTRWKDNARGYVWVKPSQKIWTP